MAKKEHRIRTRLDDAELATFHILLEQSKLNESFGFLRRAALSTQVKALPPTELSAILNEARVLRHNINQFWRSFMAKREHRIWTRLDDAELATFHKLLEQSRLQNSAEFLRQAALFSQVKALPPAELGALLREARAQGNNLNQLTKKINLTGSTPNEASDVLRDVRRQQKIIIAMLESLL